MANDDELITSPYQVEDGVVSPGQVFHPTDLGEMDPLGVNEPDSGDLDLFNDVPDAPGNDQPNDIEMPPMDMARSQEVSGGMGQSQSFSGITDRGTKKAGGFFGAAQNRAEQRNAELQSQFQQDSARLNDTIARRRQGMAELAAIDQEHQEGLLDIRRQARDFQLKEAKLEELAYNKAMQGATQYIAAYKQEMAGVRQLMLQSGNPLGGLTAVEGGALGAALFAQGFLGARGIQVNVAGQVDRWVEREMQAHQQMIQNQTNAAEGNLTLFNLARQGAMDDVQARQRMRGFVLDALKSSIYMEAARYKSQSALADAQVKAAELDALALSNEMAMRDKLVKHQLDIYGQEIQAAKYQADASREAYATAIDARYKQKLGEKIDAEIEAEKNKPKKAEPVKPVTTFADPFNVKRDWLGKAISGGKETWMLDPNEEAGIRSQAAKEGGERTRFWAEQGTNLIKLKDLFASAKGDMKGPEWFRNKKSKEYREYQQVKNYLTEWLQKDVTGAAAPDEQAARIQGWLKADDMFQIGSNMGMIDNFIELQRNRYEKAMDNTPGIIRIKDGEYREPLTASPELRNNYLAANSPEAGLTKAEEKAGEAKGVDRFMPVEGAGSKLYRMFVASGGGRATASDERPASPGTFVERVGAQMGDGMINADKQVDGLVDMIIHPNKYADRWNGESPEEFAKNAYKQLEQLDTDYAKYAETMIRSQPEAVKIIME